MDIQKIKELALANGFKLKEQASGNMDLNTYVYDFANAIEQQAKAQAVPEGFVLVSMCVSEETKQKMLRVFNESDGFLNCENIYKVMIEAAQEPAND